MISALGARMDANPVRQRKKVHKISKARLLGEYRKRKPTWTQPNTGLFADANKDGNALTPVDFISFLTDVLRGLKPVVEKLLTSLTGANLKEKNALDIMWQRMHDYLRYLDRVSV
eukprot:GHVU01202909.1.p3 GENE.GHVU01202909.1~~GHVU01202909.1.p3  ORF type:complete len:115 (-),score=14.82 GHVU01202909.1:1553-1897(-)